VLPTINVVLMWFLLQLAIVGAFLWLYTVTWGAKELAAPAVIFGLGAAWIITGLVTRLIDWWRFKRSGARHGDETIGGNLRLHGTDRHISDGAEKRSRPRIGQDIR